MILPGGWMGWTGHQPILSQRLFFVRTLTMKEEKTVSEPLKIGIKYCVE